MSRIRPCGITGLVLAGGLGSRMGGVDKGLQSLHGDPLALHALRRLRMQQGDLVGECLVNANRNLDAYRAFGAPVWPDTLAGHAGPLAGFATGLAHCQTPCLLTVPCDSPFFPLDLAERLALAFEADPQTEIALAAAPDDHGVLRPQPVFCLLRPSLLASITAFIQDGGRKAGQWIARHRTATVPFDRPGDDPRAFCNANTLAELQALENH